jgi:hypothetical protein
MGWSFQGRIPDGPKAHDLVYEIHNDGPLPILGVDVSGWSWGSRRRVTWRLRPIDQLMTGKSAPGGAFGNTDIAPWTRTSEQELPPQPRIVLAGEPPPIMITFRDGRGRQWVRWPDGRLSRMSTSRHVLASWASSRRDQARLQEFEQRLAAPGRAWPPIGPDSRRRAAVWLSALPTSCQRRSGHMGFNVCHAGRAKPQITSSTTQRATYKAGQSWVRDPPRPPGDLRLCSAWHTWTCQPKTNGAGHKRLARP